MKKTKALVYIFTNTRLLRGRLGADPLRWYEDNVFLEDEDKGGNDDSNMDDRNKGVNGDLNMDDGDNDEKYYGVEGNEGNEPFNDDKRRDGEVGENIGNRNNIGIFY